MNVRGILSIMIGGAMLLGGAASCTKHPEPARDADAGGGQRGASAASGDVERSGAGERKAPPADPKTIWSGESGRHTVRWLRDDILIGGGPAAGSDFSLAAEIRKEWANDDSSAATPCEHESSFRPLSVVGSLISVERLDYINCPGTAHPGVIAWYSVIDAANPGRVVALNELVAEGDIFAALMADPIVKKTLAKSGAQPPRSLPELVTALAASEGECEYAFGEDFLAHFAFHHLEGDRVAVRLGLSHGVEACRGTLTQIGILLPVPPKLADALRAADAGRSGYLMRDLKKIAGDAKGKIASS